MGPVILSISLLIFPVRQSEFKKNKENTHEKSGKHLKIFNFSCDL